MKFDGFFLSGPRTAGLRHAKQKILNQRQVDKIRNGQDMKREMKEKVAGDLQETQIQR